MPLGMVSLYVSNLVFLCAVRSRSFLSFPWNWQSHNARMFPQCFPVLPYGKHCFKSQFLFPINKICFCFTAETFCVSARHWTTCFLMFPGFATTDNICYLSTIARFPVQEKNNMADSRENSRETSASIKKKKKSERLCTDEEIELLITSYEERKCLWDLTSSETTERHNIHPHKWLVRGRVLRWQFTYNCPKCPPLVSSSRPQSVWPFLSLLLSFFILPQGHNHGNHNIDLNIGHFAIVKCARKMFESAHAPVMFPETIFHV